MQVTRIMILASVAAATTSCAEEARAPMVERETYSLIADDAGDWSWARQVVPKLVGRKVRGAAELDLIVDLIAEFGRVKVAYALLSLPEAKAHWAGTIVDKLRVNLEGPKNQEACLGAPLHASPSPTLSQKIAAGNAAGGPVPGEPPFNLADVVNSAVEDDDLSVVYRAYLFAMVNKPARPGFADQSEPDLGITFARVYTGRNLGCLPCHNSFRSSTGASTGWNRTHPLPGMFEEALYGRHHGPASGNPRDVHVLFREDVLGGPMAPWGMDASCGKFRAPGSLGDRQDMFFTRALGKKASVWELEAILRSGIDGLKTQGLGRVGTALPHADRAFAYLVAARAVEDIWREVMGAPLTVVHGFPRNAAQRVKLQHLVEGGFTQNWSLRDLLVRIVTSDEFNRRPPDVAGGPTPYDVDPIYDPWSEWDPRTLGPPPHPPEANHNTMTDGVHRYSPRHLLHAVHRALGWPAASRFPRGDHPDLALHAAIGHFVTDSQPGFASVDFQGLLAWEATHGACEKPPGFGDDDWIDALVAAIADHDAANPGDPLTVRAVVSLMRDWMLAEGAIQSAAPVGESSGEEDLLADHFGASLDDPTGSVSDLVQRLRELCGVYLETPQFMLAGIASDAEPEPPPIRVCLPGEDCSYQAMCDELLVLVPRTGLSIIECFEDSFRVTYHDDPIAIFSGFLCPPHMCRPFREVVDLACVSNPLACFREAPLCDPRCLDGLCCDATPPIEDGVFLAWAEGGTVRAVDGVYILPAAEGDWRLLEEKDTLSVGDLIRLPAGSSLELDAPDGTLMTEGPAPEHPQEGAQWMIRVTGESALAPLQHFEQAPGPSTEEMEEIMATPWHRWGEAGPPGTGDPW